MSDSRMKEEIRACFAEAYSTIVELERAVSALHFRVAALEHKLERAVSALHFRVAALEHKWERFERPGGYTIPTAGERASVGGTKQKAEYPSGTGPFVKALAEVVT